jgi:hypothetical protein
MKLECKDLSVSDEELGCTITFSQEKEETKWESNMSIEELTRSLKPYILLQRSYAEDEFEDDYYYFETLDFDKSGELKDFTIEVHRKQILINYNNELFEITINVNNKEFDDLKASLKKIANKEGQLKIYE